MMVFIAAVSNFYFFYVLVLLTVLYVIFRYFCLYQENRWKNLLLCFLKFMGTALLGVAMAAVLFLPAVLSFLSSSRSDTQYLFPLFYNRAFYEKVLGAFVSIHLQVDGRGMAFPLLFCWEWEAFSETQTGRMAKRTHCFFTVGFTSSHSRICF